MLTRHLVRAILAVLQRHASQSSVLDQSWYHTECLAAQLQQRGIAVRVHYPRRELVLDETITLPLYSQEALHPNNSDVQRGPLLPDLDTLCVRALDLAAIPYRYCFDEEPAPHVPARGHPRAARPWLAAGFFPLRAGWRLFLLFTPTPRECMRALLGLRRQAAPCFPTLARPRALSPATADARLPDPAAGGNGPARLTQASLQNGIDARQCQVCAFCRGACAD